MLKNTKSLFIFGSIYLPTLLFSQGFYGVLNKMSGEVGLEYSDDVFKDETKSTKKNRLSEVIELGYKDFIYSSRLLEYSIQTKFSLDQSKDTSNGSQVKTTNGVNDYRLYLTFLKKSKYPATLTMSQSMTPSTVVNSDGVLQTNYNQQNFALNGLVVLDKKTRANYTLSTTKTDSQNSDGVQNNVNNNYTLGYNKQFKDITVSTNLGNSNSEESKNYGDLNVLESNKNHISAAVSNKEVSFDIDYTTREDSNSVDKAADSLINDMSTSAKWKYSKEIRFSNSISTSEDKTNSTENFSDNFNFTWYPNKKYNLTMALSTNEFTTPEDTSTNNTFSANSYYMISKQLSTSQNLSYYTYESNSDDTQSIVLDLFVLYETLIWEKSSLNLTGKTSGLVDSGNEEEENGNTYSYDLTAEFTTRFDNLNSVLKYDINYYQSFSTLINEEQKIRVGAAFRTKFIENIYYNTYADYTYRKTFAMSESDSNSVGKDLNFFNGLSTSKNLDVRGRLTSSAGLTYANSQKSNSETLSTLNPTANVKFMYRLWRTMTFKSDAEISKDSLYETTNYLMNARLLYKFRKLTIELGTSFNKQTGGDSGDISSSNLNFEFKRKL